MQHNEIAQHNSHIQMCRVKSKQHEISKSLTMQLFKHSLLPTEKHRKVVPKCVCSDTYFLMSNSLQGFQAACVL